MEKYSPFYNENRSRTNQKAKVLTEEQIRTFFMDAADEVFLLEKVILLFGIRVYGA
jgi:hypothetical protein